MKISELELPCKLVLDDYQGFLAHAKEQGENNYRMAQMIADLGVIRVYSVEESVNHVPLLSTGVCYGLHEIGLSEDELKFFTPHKSGL